MCVCISDTRPCLYISKNPSDDDAPFPPLPAGSSSAQVLKLIHDRVVDTAALFPHPSGLPYKHALKKLAKEYLCKDIQDGKGAAHLRFFSRLSLVVDSELSPSDVAEETE
jgi:hypothetical protein